MKQETSTSPKISVIVPVYNAEKTIRRCVDSLLSQSFSNFEVLLIDDGSPDQCGVICDEYAKQDSRVHVFHQESRGVSAARQCGIDNAQGEYTIHADPDDWVEPEMLEELYKKAKDDNADMVICDFYENTYKGQKYLKQQPSFLDSKVVLKELFENLHGSCCNKLIKRKCICDYEISFPIKISFCEDLYVNASLLCHDISVSYLKKAFYHYVKNSDISLSRRYDINSEKHNFLLRDMFVDLVKNTELESTVYEKFSCMIVAKAFWGGEKIYTSRKFKYRFSSFRRYLKNVSDKKEKFLLLFSCCGFYHPTIDFVSIVLKVKFFVIKNIFRRINPF